jgi:hypothetical protein
MSKHDGVDRVSKELAGFGHGDWVNGARFMKVGESKRPPEHPVPFLRRDHHGEDGTEVALGRGLRTMSHISSGLKCPDSLLIQRLLQLFRPVQGWRHDTKLRKGT